MSTKVTVSSADSGLRQTIIAGSHSFIADAPKAVGGNEEGADPHQLLLSSLGACTAMTLQIFAGKRNWPLKHVRVELEEEQTDDPQTPGQKRTIFKRNIEVAGDLTQEQIDTLKNIADKCPVHKILTGPKDITTGIKHTAGAKA